MNMKKVLSVFLALVIMLGVIPSMSFAVSADDEPAAETVTITNNANTGAMTVTLTIPERDPVPYIDADGTEKQTGPDCYDVYGTDTSLGIRSMERWYVVRENMTLAVDDCLNILGDVKLIISDGATLTLSHGINTDGGSLTVYAQSTDPATMGKLIANAHNDSYAAIGSSGANNPGSITINGCDITATGSTSGAAIGGGAGRTNVNVNIKGGVVHATGIGSGAAIGGNITVSGGTLNVTGGENATAISGSFTVNGGTVNAIGGANAVAISSSFTVNGGTVTANGGENAAAIGGSLTVKGGIIHATAGANANSALSCSRTFASNIYAKAGDSKDTAVDTDNNQLDDKKYVYLAKKYTVKWQTDNETVLDTAIGWEGYIPTTDVKPHKETDERCTYTFTGWNDGTNTYDDGTEFPPVTADVTYTAVFRETLHTFTVTWLNSDGTVLETDENVPYGTTPEYNGETPTLSDKRYNHIYYGWDKNLDPVTSDVTYTAIYTTSPSLIGHYFPTPDDSSSVTYALPTSKMYFTFPVQDFGWDETATLSIGPDSMVFSHSIEYGYLSIYFINGSYIVREYDDERTINASSSSPCGLIIKSGSGTSDDPYVTEWYHEAATITWKNNDGTVIETTQAPYGGVITHTDATKKDDFQYSYTFTGWTDSKGNFYEKGTALPVVSGNETYTANFNSSAKSVAGLYKITVQFSNGSSTVNKTISSSTALPYTTSSVALRTLANSSDKTGGKITVITAGDNIGTISNTSNFIIYKTGTEKIRAFNSKNNGYIDCTITVTQVAPLAPGQYIRMGTYMGVPIDWYCVKNNATGCFIISKYALKTNRFGANATYSTSDIHAWLDIDSGGTFAKDIGLTAEELSIVRTVNLSSTAGDGTDTFIIPAYANDELQKGATIHAPYAIGTTTLVSRYWLRTPRDANNAAARVVSHSDDGSPVATVAARYNSVGSSQWIRPMFYLASNAFSANSYSGNGTEADPYRFETKYNVTASTPSNGTISIKATRDNQVINTGSFPAGVAPGADVEIVATPATGYSLKRVIVKDEDNKNVKFTNNKFTMPEYPVTVTAIFGPDPAHLSQVGDVYTIHTATGWNVFCDLLNDSSYASFSGKTVVLDADISVSRMAGSSGHEFKGTFDGQGHTITVAYGTQESPYASNGAGPFLIVNSGCYIKNLHTAGTIYTKNKFAGGIIGVQNGTVTIENCRSSVTINSSLSGDATHGGLVGVNQGNSPLTIKGCVFDGKMLGASSKNCGGIVGYRNSTVNISDTLFAPAEITVSVDSNCATFARNNPTSVTNSYYTKDFGAAQGEKAYSVTEKNVTINLGKGRSYDVSGITLYDNGLSFGGKFYAAEGAEISLTAADPATNFSFTGIKVKGSDNEYVEANGNQFTMPAKDVTVFAAYAPDPAHLSQDGDVYTIHDAEGWNLFCECLLDAENFNGFSGKTVVLDADITASRIAGSDAAPFKGTFDGQGHKITANINGTSRAALFGTISGATIKNLAVDGSVTGGIHCAGLVSFTANSSTNLIENVAVNVAVTTTGTHCGGILGHGGNNTKNTLRGCSFTGSITGGTHIGVLYGWGGSSTPTIENCLEAGTAYTGTNVNPVGLISTWGTVRNTYYNNAVKGSPAQSTTRGLAAHTITTGENVAVVLGDSTEYSVSGITAYDTGIEYNGTFYAGEGDQITLTNTPPTGYVLKEYILNAGTVDGNTLIMPDDDVTVNVEFKEAKFTVTWKNGEEILELDENVDEGTVPTYDGATPVKEDDAQYTYTFAGWSPEILPATSDITYNAVFNKTIREYTVTWKNGDDVLATDIVAYGETPAYGGATPVKADDAQYTYTFTGWSPEVTAVTGDAEYTAQFTETVNEYTITWKNDDGSVIDTTTVAYGDTPTHADPEKAATAQYSYTFLGWSPAVTAVTGDAEYTAQFTETVNEYTITWKNDDGSVIDTTTVAYGDTPTHADAEKAATAQYTYTFLGWSPVVTAVTGDAEYTAQYDCTVNEYTITWKNGDDVLATDIVAYGETPVYGGETPVKADDEDYTYTFTGWSPEVTAVTGEVTYTAVFEQVAVLKFAGASLTAEDDWTLDFMVKKDLIDENGYENPYAVFEIDGNEMTISDYTANDRYYIFTIDHIQQNQLRTDVTATLYATCAGTLLSGNSITLSILDYGRQGCDINGDGTVDIKDLVRLKKLMSDVPASEKSDDVADPDFSGTLDALDLAYLRKMLLLA